MFISKFSSEIRAEIAKEYLAGAASSRDLADKYGICHKTVQLWAKRYTKNGIAAFSKQDKDSSYSAAFKRTCVEYYLQGKGSLGETVAEFNLSSTSVLSGWISRYNAYQELKDAVFSRTT